MRPGSVFAASFGVDDFVISFDDIGGVGSILEQVFEKVKKLGKKRSPVLSNRTSQATIGHTQVLLWARSAEAP